MSVPGGGEAVTVYCPLPGPVTLLIDQTRFALPLLLIVKVCEAGAAPPQLAANARDVGETAGPPPMLAPESGKGEGRGAQSVPVALMVIDPVLLGPVGEKVTSSLCVPPAEIAKLGSETVKGAGPEPAAPVDSVTVAALVPVFLTLKLWDTA